MNSIRARYASSISTLRKLYVHVTKVLRACFAKAQKLKLKLSDELKLSDDPDDASITLKWLSLSLLEDSLRLSSDLDTRLRLLLAAFGA